ncbi:MAG TPA: pyruvate kinase [Thermoplasmata archaeon]|nr:pyruvate kinase [Thermoplasmata archaeon]
MRRTRILATLGPATRTPARIDGLLAAGADAVRVNFSHGGTDEHRRLIQRARAAGRRAKHDVAVVADLQGPKVRIGDLARPSIELQEGAPWRLDASGRPGDAVRVSVSYPPLLREARPGARLLVGDGNVELRVVGHQGAALIGRVLHGGAVSAHAGLYLPGGGLRPNVLGRKDSSDLEVAVEEGVDFLAVSFVRDARDLIVVRRRLDRLHATGIGLIAKIERAEALEHIDRIVEVSDAIMVARGDLGIEVPLARLALEQKRLIAIANRARRPVIVATQMLLSMVHAPRPTRAEATDAANAVIDGADALMLSEESAVGAFPAEAVGWLDRICRATELAASLGEVEIHADRRPSNAVDDGVAGAAVALAADVGARAIVIPTESGRTARLVAARRPSTPILALSSNGATRRRLSLTWGVETVGCPVHLSLRELRRLARQMVDRTSGIPKGGPIVLTAGYPVEGRPTNLVTVDPAGTDRKEGPSPPGRARGRRQGS